MPLLRFFVEHTALSTPRVFRTSAQLPEAAKAGVAPPVPVSSRRRLPATPGATDDGARAPARLHLDAQASRPGVSGAGALDRTRFRPQRTARSGGDDDAASADVGGAPAPIIRSTRPPNPFLRRPLAPRLGSDLAPRLRSDAAATGERDGGAARLPASRMSNIERLLTPGRERHAKMSSRTAGSSLAAAEVTSLPVFDQALSSRDLDFRQGSARRNGSIGCFPAAVITLRESRPACRCLVEYTSRPVSVYRVPHTHTHAHRVDVSNCLVSVCHDPPLIVV